jgi:peptidoglycan/xylan/chitin deacetylase (PgdA/CDA1 family)
MLIRHSAIAVLLVCAGAAACGGSPPSPPTVTAPLLERVPETVEATPEAPVEALPEPAAVGANELGEIPVLMYHRILPGGGGEYDRAPDEFRAELAYLHEHGYRPIRVIDLVRGQIDVPAGTTPVVLTFDDSTREQMAFTEDGAVDPDTAVGILLDFAAEHPDFTPTASFYVNAGPFGGGGDSADILRWLHDHGFELGNHTARHANLRALDGDGVRRELALGARVITDVVPHAAVRTLSLPLGIWPEDRTLAYRGEWEGDGYEHEGVLLVGAHPARSPFHAEFDPRAIPRIRSWTWDGGEANYGSGFWLDVLERHPERRYVSDGDPSRISFPAELGDRLDPAFAARAAPY